MDSSLERMFITLLHLTNSRRGACAKSLHRDRGLIRNLNGAA
jgi:hypothetical protein